MTVFNDKAYNNYNVFTTNKEVCILNKSGGIIRKIPKKDIINIEFLNKDNFCVFELGREEIMTIGFTYIEK